MSFIHNSANPRCFGVVFSCGLCVAACGAAPDGTDTAGATDTVASKLCDTCDPSDPPPPPGPRPPSDIFQVHAQGMEIPVSCDSGWEGDWAEVYWDIKAVRGGGWTVPLSSRSSDNYVIGGPVPPSAFPSWINIDVRKDISVGAGANLTIDASAWDADDGLEWGDDWMGHVIRTVNASQFSPGQNLVFGEVSKGGEDGCRFNFWYDITFVGRM